MTPRAATIVVTRSEDADGPLTRLFMAAGQNVLHWQVTAVVPPEDSMPLRTAVSNIATYDWIVFSSAAAVETLLALHPDAPRKVRIAAVGAATAAGLKRAGWPVDLVPAKTGAEHLVAALLEQSRPPRRVLFPASAIALPTLARQLRQAGVQVDQIEAYRTVNTASGAENWRDALRKRAVDAITFASPSAVIGLRQALSDAAFARLEGLVVAAIGATTAEALRQNGLSVTAIANRSTLEDLAAATLGALIEKKTPAQVPAKGSVP